MIHPCKNCTKRPEGKGCGAYHDICEAYHTFKAEHTKLDTDAEINGYEAHKKYRLKQIKIDRAKARARRG